jgi:cell division protein FtsW
MTTRRPVAPRPGRAPTVSPSIAPAGARRGDRRSPSATPGRATPGGRTPGRSRGAGVATSGSLVLVATVVVLNLVGLVMVLSASSVTALHEFGSSWHFFIRQAAWVTVGLLAFAVVMRIDYHRWRRWLVPLVGGTALLLIAVLAVGIEVNGARRWLGNEWLSIQPSELAKLAIILFAADLLARRVDQMDRVAVTMRPVVVVLLVFAGLVLVQPNLGTTLLLGGITVTVLFVAGTPLRSLLVLGGAGIAAVTTLALVAPYRRERMTTFLDPWADPENAGYQSIQSATAIANGGFFGRGLGEGRAKWEFLPEAHTDFIYSILAEELGLTGALLVLVLFVTFAIFGVRTALRAPDRFGTLVATGITAWIVIQAAVNLGAALVVLPITGVPLPFVSFGGSALLVTMVATGVLVNIARQAD